MRLSSLTRISVPATSSPPGPTEITSGLIDFSSRKSRGSFMPSTKGGSAFTSVVALTSCPSGPVTVASNR